MLMAMLLSAFVGQPSAPAVDVSVVYEPSQLVVTAHAGNGRRVRAITLQPEPKRVATNREDPGPYEPVMPKPIAARAQKAMSKGGLRATFALPSRVFWVVVTLDDGSVHQVARQGWRQGTAAPPEVKPPQPYTVERYLGDVPTPTPYKVTAP